MGSTTGRRSFDCWKPGHFLLRFVVLTGLVVALASPAPAGQDHPSLDYDADTPIDVMHVKGQVYMIVVGGAHGVNIAAQVGDQGIFLVDSGPPALSDKLLETLREEFDDKPVRFLFNTHSHGDHTGGNLRLAETFGTEGNNPNAFGGVKIASRLNTLNRLAGYTRDESDVIPELGLPYGAFFGERMDFYLNDRPVMVLAAPSAHTDGDAIVWFPGSDVVATGDTFVLDQYPIIDSERGGSIQGFLDVAKRIVDDITVADVFASGGTRVIPGHGRLANEAEVMDYLLMLTVIWERVESMVDEGMTLEEVRAARPTLEYDGMAGGDKEYWTAEMFLEAVYQEAVANRAAR